MATVINTAPGAPLVDPMLPVDHRIQRVTQETDDTFTLELVPTSRKGKGPFAPGQFNMVYVFGVGEVPISISSDPSKAPAIRAYYPGGRRRDQSDGRLKRGDMVGIRGPFGTSWPVEEAGKKDVVLVAGGIGLAPLRPTLYRLWRSARNIARLSCCTVRVPLQDMLYRNELEQWRGHFDLDVLVTVDRAASGWRGNVGLVTTLIHARRSPRNTVAMVCGPEMMMRATVMGLKNAVNPRRSHLSLDGTQYEMRHRHVRSLPVRPQIRLQRWANFYIS